MNMNLFKKVLNLYLTANVGLHVWGDGGIGKSQVIESVVEQELNWHLVDLRLATQEVGDLIGLPYTEKRTIQGENGPEERTIQSWSMPEWMVGVFEAAAQGRPTVVFMDEMDRAPKEVIQAVYQLCTKKQLHNHKLPSTTRIIAAGNPPTEEYMVDAFDSAMTSRWGHVHVDADADTWLAQFGTRCNSDISGFIATAKNHLMRKTSAWDVDAICRPTPRCWEMVNRIYEAGKDGDKSVLRVAIAAIVGASTATEFMNSLDKDWIKLDDVLSGKKSLADLKKSEDANIYTIRLAHEVSYYLTDKKISTNQDGEKYKPREIEARKERLFEFMNHLIDDRKELMIAAIKIVIDRDAQLFRTLISGSPKIYQVTSEAAELSKRLGSR